ncbi:uncharacterized protein LOC144446754 [Glandiceps talaboti]
MASITFTRPSFGVHRPRLTMVRKYHPYASRWWRMGSIDTLMDELAAIDDHYSSDCCHHWLREESEANVIPTLRQIVRRRERRKENSSESKGDDKNKCEHLEEQREEAKKDEAATSEVEKIPNESSMSEGECSGQEGDNEEACDPKESPENFRLAIAIESFKPEDLKLMAKGNKVTVIGKYSNEMDHGDGVYSTDEREFRHTYTLPDNVDATELKSKMNEDGLLTIEAPRLASGKIRERIIPITFPKTAEIEDKSKTEDISNEENEMSTETKSDEQ